MITYVAELIFPGAGHLTGPEVDAIARRSSRLSDELGPGVEWLTGYLTDDGVYAVYRAEGEQLVREHLARLGLVAGAVERVTAVVAGSAATDTGGTR